MLIPGQPNIIVDDSGHPRITDYGIATVFASLSLTKVYRCMRWANPQRSSEREGDIFSFAMVIVEVGCTY
jgi:serine/threonine protein kinase